MERDRCIDVFFRKVIVFRGFLRRTVRGNEEGFSTGKESVFFNRLYCCLKDVLKDAIFL